ncbi:Flavonol reductase/cinnamoyl-CoA reductase [Handroanthus impetiginosus]|uniref:Flavonol reductase/cinnamoyl-CoA reductase n=1 Tax=Handroanthus impetiginosus TaxID=429701 RepID=A0A2G9HZX9_9LAMI|nr:Flavonol reductase/cinnamoyl-CoA reductase [Handroanthus impetiginosus]
MGIVRLEETKDTELQEFCRTLLSCPAMHRRKEDDDGFWSDENVLPAGNGDVLDRLVCVTSSVSDLGVAIVKQLLVNCYCVLIIGDNEEDVEKLREMEISVVMAKLTEIESLTQAFDGFRGVFTPLHLWTPLDYPITPWKAMAGIEVSTTKNVMKACGVTPSVRKCVLTLSLLTYIWRDYNTLHEIPHLVDNKCWSNELVCLNKKLRYALGKLKAEKAGWEIAKDTSLKLVTICPGLITGLEKISKGVYEEMRKTAFGQYICFNRVIEREDEIEKLARETGTSVRSIAGSISCSNKPQFELSNVKLTRLMLGTRRCYNE